MSHEPPVPKANRSPYPLNQPAHASVALAKDSGEKPTSGSETRAVISVGAALVLGAAATIATLLFTRRTRPTRKAASR